MVVENLVVEVVEEWVGEDEDEGEGDVWGMSGGTGQG